MKILLFFMLFISFAAFSEELRFRVEESSPYALPGREFIQYLNKGDIIVCENKISGDRGFAPLTPYHSPIILFTRDETSYWTPVEHLIPVDTRDTFSQDILLNHEQSNRALWVPSYYADVLGNKERDLFIEFEPSWFPYAQETPVGTVYWYDNYNLQVWGEIAIYNAVIKFGAKDVVINEIINTGYGYKIICIESSYNNTHNNMAQFDWLLTDGQMFFDLLMYIDGDYIDLYINDTSQKFGSIMRVEKEFATQFESLIKTNTCDLTNVIWPRRADKQIETGKTYRTAEILRLRTSEDRNSELVMEMPVNTVVHVLEVGTKDSIDGITANWVQVRLVDGTEGWCFGGYLLPDVVPVSVSKDSDLPEGNTAQEAVVTESPPQTPAFPFMFLIAVVGGTVILAAVVVFLIRRKR